MALLFKSSYFKYSSSFTTTCSYVFQLEALGAENDEEAAKAAEYIGRAVGLTNLLRGTAHHADRGVVFLPKDLLTEHQVRVPFKSYGLHVRQVEEGVVLRKESTDGVKLVAAEIAGRTRELLMKVSTVTESM